ncbi:Mo-dependent nitrogenase C-terminal domain-containing protein [Nostoc sp.]|uniref:Mo-dependent nitrogenase C-terminal domain-containing protein n=1 Tax=Nostoc sp. TaxID=1180 RepID=UPI002FFC4F51
MSLAAPPRICLTAQVNYSGSELFVILGFCSGVVSLKAIPAQCPFERDITLFGRKLLHIPPMCKLNPLYEEVVGLRFKALCYLADECGEDVTAYC